MGNDFEFVKTLLEQFFSQKHTRERLKHIEYNKITGWEIWFQIAFSVFIDCHLEVAGWGRELLYTIDRRSARNRKHMVIDFILRKKHAAHGQYIAIEIKQNSVMSLCIRGMMEDIRKLWLVRNSENNLRSVWCIGIHPTVSEDDFTSCVEKYTGEFGVKLAKNRIVTNNIKGTNLSYSLF